MAFEIYTGTASSLNDIIDKMIEMWEFDESDTTSSVHTATYGNAVIKGQNQILFNGGTAVSPSSSIFSAGATFHVIKSDTAIMATWLYSNYMPAIVVGTLTNTDGSTGKGVLFQDPNQSLYAVMGEETNSQWSISSLIRTSDGVMQLVPYVSPVGGWYFDNCYWTIIDTSLVKQGKYIIGEDTFYIARRIAIKEE